MKRLLAFPLIIYVGCTPREGAAVEAPMLSADASAASMALMSSAQPAGPSGAPTAHGPTEESPFKSGDRLTGFYTCNQGKTAMVITFERVMEGQTNGDPDPNHWTFDYDAVFEFHYDGSKAGFAKADGSARMSGTFDPKGRKLRLKGEEWIDQPPNYSLIALVGVVNKAGQFSGTVDGYGCTSFSAILDRP